MDTLHKNTVPLNKHTQYKVGATTYDVTAHFDTDKDTLKSKIISLIKNNTKNINAP